jgi:hypothetical protein
VTIWNLKRKEIEVTGGNEESEPRQWKEKYRECVYKKWGF